MKAASQRGQSRRPCRIPVTGRPCTAAPHTWPRGRYCSGPRAVEAATGRVWWSDRLRPRCPARYRRSPYLQAAAPWTVHETSPPAPPSTSLLLARRMVADGPWRLSHLLDMAPTPRAPPSRLPPPPRRDFTNCPSSPRRMNCTFSPNTSGARRASRTRKGGALHACARAPGASALAEHLQTSTMRSL